MIRNSLLIPLAALTLAGCSSNEKSGCDFNKATIAFTPTGSNKPSDKKVISDCFIKSKPDETGLVEVKGKNTADKFDVLYYDAPTVDMLTLKFANATSDWRRKQGHDIFKVEKPDTLGFIFGDRRVALKGSVIFNK